MGALTMVPLGLEAPTDAASGGHRLEGLILFRLRRQVVVLVMATKTSPEPC